MNPDEGWYAVFTVQCSPSIHKPKRKGVTVFT